MRPGCEHGVAALEAGPEARVGAPARLEIVERISWQTLSIYWSDARTGLYADQHWRLGRARERSVCALTGAAIEVGDLIYRPRAHGPGKPANGHFMILAAMVQAERAEHDADGPLTVRHRA
jgi:Domain of unknown function (DUF3331)